MNRNLSIKQRPFGVVPDTRFYFPHQSIQAALETVVRAVTRAEGPIAVLGGSGFGKSLLVELVCEALYDRLDTVKLQSARICSRQALLQSILYELQMPYRGLSEGELRLSLLDRLEPSPETAPEGILVVVDEAHTLHAKLLDELRLLTNFSRNNQCRVRLVLLGSMRLEETLASPMLESLNQRLAARCYLQPMNREETFEYVRHQLRIAGQNPESFITADALRCVFAASDGIPRLVNQVMDHAMVAAAQRSHEKITSELVNDSWAELQQLPTPWSSGSSRSVSSHSSDSVEFGLLEDSEFDLATVQENLHAPNLPVPSNIQLSNKCEPACQDADCHGSNYQVSQGLDSPALEGDPNGNEVGSEHNFFAAFAYPASDLEVVIEESIQGGPIAANGRQRGDHESDPMEVWENDPPLLETNPQTLHVESPIAYDLENDLESEDRTEELFGSDFDLEVVLPRKTSLLGDAPTAIASSAHGMAQENVHENENYIVRIQRNADTLSHLEQFEVQNSTVKPALDEALDPIALTRNEPSLWSINVGATSSDLREEDSIEDMISQLNFSAFTVDPFSVEQIPLQSDGVPIDSCDLFRPSEPIGLPEGIRVNKDQQVMMHHRPIESNQYFEARDDFDDDRDLLIVEEQVGSTNQMLLQNLPSEPAQKPSPYAQLFARLRK